MQLDHSSIRSLLTQCLATAGFKLDTLLKLADVKGTDRKTSLLHFVLDQLLKESSAMLFLPRQLSDVKAAANLQASCKHTIPLYLKSGVGSQLWLIELGVLLPGLEAHVCVAGKQP